MSTAVCTLGRSLRVPLPPSFPVSISPAVPFSSFPPGCSQSELQGKELLAAFLLVACLLMGFLFDKQNEMNQKTDLSPVIDWTLRQRETDVNHSPEIRTSCTEPDVAHRCVVAKGLAVFPGPSPQALSP